MFLDVERGIKAKHNYPNLSINAPLLDVLVSTYLVCTDHMTYNSLFMMCWCQVVSTYLVITSAHKN
jgi:hypothetical protein